MVSTQHMYHVFGTWPSCSFLRSLVASSLPNSYQFQKQAFYPYRITRAQFWIRSRGFRCLDTETHVKFKLILGWGILGSRFPSPKICLNYTINYKLLIDHIFPVILLFSSQETVRNWSQQRHSRWFHSYELLIHTQTGDVARWFQCPEVNLWH